MEVHVINQMYDLFHRSNEGKIDPKVKKDVIEVSNFLTVHGKDVRKFDCYIFAVLLGFLDSGRSVFTNEKLYTV